MKNLATQKPIWQHSILILVIYSFVFFPSMAQEVISFSQLEKLQDKNMDNIETICKITKSYPAFAYTFEKVNDEINSITITGVENEMDKEKLKVAIIDLNSNKNLLKSKANRMGVFYSVDKNARFKDGEKAFQMMLNDNLHYPENAKDWGAEGTIFVKFVVDTDGNIPYITTSENLDTDIEAYKKDLEKQAVSAVKSTSGKWIPAKLDGVEVPSLLVVPVSFELKKEPWMPMPLTTM